MKQEDFTIKQGKLDKKEIKESAALAEQYFGTGADPEQAPVNEENARWLRTLGCLMVIRHKKEIIGFSVIVPCTKKLMNSFVSKNITERQLFEEIKRTNAYESREAIYFCSVFVKPDYRGKGLALASLIKSIKQNFNLKKSPPLFYWAYSTEGDKLATKISQTLNLPLYKRK